jgi:hypothetical protein
VEAEQVGGHPRRLRPQQLRGVGFFFWGMIDEPDAHASETSAKPNSSLDHSTSSAPSRERWVAQVVAAARKSRTKSRLETASIEFGDTPAKPELARHEAAVGVEVHARQRPRAERELGRGAQHELEARGVAAEHPEVREQVVRQVHGLRALEMRVARHRPVLVALGERDEHALQTLELLERLQRVRASEHRHVGRDLVVARARGVQLAADRPDDLRQPALDRHVDVLVVVAEAKRPPSISSRHPLEAPEQRVAVGTR